MINEDIDYLSVNESYGPLECMANCSGTCSVKWTTPFGNVYKRNLQLNTTDSVYGQYICSTYNASDTKEDRCSSRTVVVLPGK